MTTDLVELDLICPACISAFIVSAWDENVPAPFMKKAVDFRPVYINVAHNPLRYHVFLCRVCGYAGTADMYRDAEGGILLRPQLQGLRWNLEFAWQSTLEVYYHAVKCAVWAAIQPFEIADLALKAAHFAASIDDHESERWFKRVAVDYFTGALRRFDGVDREQRPPLTYLVGELHRQLNNPSTAQSWFEAAIETAGDTPEFQWLITACNNQLTNPREFF